MNLCLAAAASKSGDNSGIAAVFLIALVLYVGYHAYIFFYRPELWAAMRQRAHEQKLAKEAAKREAKGKLLGGVAGAATKIALGALFNRRHH